MRFYAKKPEAEDDAFFTYEPNKAPAVFRDGKCFGSEECSTKGKSQLNSLFLLALRTTVEVQIPKVESKDPYLPQVKKDQVYDLIVNVSVQTGLFGGVAENLKRIGFIRLSGFQLLLASQAQRVGQSTKIPQ